MGAFGNYEMEQAAAIIVANDGVVSALDFKDNYSLIGFSLLIAYGWLELNEETKEFEAKGSFWERLKENEQ